MDKKYILIGGVVTSKTDGDEHYISPYKLQKLYNLNPNECIFVKDDNPKNLRVSLLGRNIDNCIILRPKYNGDYKIK